MITAIRSTCNLQVHRRLNRLFRCEGQFFDSDGFARLFCTDSCGHIFTPHDFPAGKDDLACFRADIEEKIDNT